MEAFINTPGSALKISNGLILIENKEASQSFVPEKVNQILVSVHASLTTDFILTCLKHGIDLVILDAQGAPLGRFWNGFFGSTPEIRRKQLEAACGSLGLITACRWISEKISGQGDFLKKIHEKRHKTFQTQDFFEGLKKQALQAKSQETLMGLEGKASAEYFKTLSEFLPREYRFEGRSRQPARDPFNAFLNYAYGVLYSLTEKAIIEAGLDPVVGFLHSDGYQKKSFVFDMIENFRIYADKTVFTLFSRKQVSHAMTDVCGFGVSLNFEGKKMLMQALNDYLDKTIDFLGRRMKRRDSFKAFCRREAMKILGREEEA